MMAPHIFQRPASIKSGASTTQTLSPLIQALTNSHASNLLTAGCTIEFNTLRSFSFPNTILPNFSRSSDLLSAWRICGPKWATRAERAYESGSTATRARTSRSMTGTPCACNCLLTVDLPACVP